MSVVASPQRLSINEAVVFAELNDEAVLLNVETGIYFGLDGTGATIWRLLSEGLSPDGIVARMLEEYDVDPAKLQADVTTFLDKLRRKGLLAVVDG